MKCPKCGYLGFETVERCRNCGYDFSLAIQIESPSELPLHARAEPEAPLSDFDLSTPDASDAGQGQAVGLDLDRIIGAEAPPQGGSVTVENRAPESAIKARAIAGTSTAVATPPPESLSLFGQSQAESDEVGRPIAAPRPARPPLAVRRATPDVARRRTPRIIRRDDDELALQLETSAATEAMQAETGADVAPAPRVRRVFGALIDLALLAAIDVAVIYLTLAITGLSFDTVGLVPPIPMGAFLLLLNGGYLVAFTTAHGQTIGKMVARIRVVDQNGGRVGVAGALYRTAGIIVSLLALGLPYLAVLVSADRRALHDRLAGTHVVKIP